MNVTDLLLSGSAWWVLPCSLIALGAVFGLMPGLLLRLIVLFYPKDHPRRDELFGELYDPEMGRVERFEWVFQQLELASRQGLSLRKQARTQRRAKDGQQDSESQMLAVEPTSPALLSDNTAVVGEIRIVLPGLSSAPQERTQTLYQVKYGPYGNGRHGPYRELFPGNRPFRLGGSTDEVPPEM